MPKLMTRMRTVLKRAAGIRPPSRAASGRRSIARGPTASLQYGHTRSFVVIKARQCGHMRRESIWNHHSRECAAIASGKESKFGAECSRKGFFGVGQALLDIMHA